VGFCWYIDISCGTRIGGDFWLFGVSGLRGRGLVVDEWWYGGPVGAFDEASFLYLDEAAVGSSRLHEPWLLDGWYTFSFALN
jgi:hypothetical protein